MDVLFTAHEVPIELKFVDPDHQVTLLTSEFVEGFGQLRVTVSGSVDVEPNYRSYSFERSIFTIHSGSTLIHYRADITGRITSAKVYHAPK
jgi:hypothetical protein